MRKNGWPKLLRDVVGMKVRTLRDLRNGYCTIPAGTIVTVGRSSIAWTKMELSTDRCSCCGVRVHMSRVNCAALQPLPPLVNAPAVEEEPVDPRLLQLADDGCPHA